MRSLAREIHLERKATSACHNEELGELWDMLKAVSIKETEEDPMQMDYEIFLEAGQRATKISQSLEEFFKPPIFLILHHNGDGLINVDQLFDFIMKVIAARDLRLRLALYDRDGFGYLKVW